MKASASQSEQAIRFMSTHVHLFMYVIIYFVTIEQIYLHRTASLESKGLVCKTNEWMF